MTQQIYPAVDLHLLVNAEIPLRAFAALGGVRIDLATQPVFALQLFPQNPSPPPPPPIVEFVNHRVIGRTVGSTFATLRLQWGAPPGARFNVAMRCTVHHALRQLLLPQPSISVETGRVDRILSVYGRFETATGQSSTHDITSHSYLEYSVAVLSGAPTVTVDPLTGRLKSGDSPGTARITISVAAGLAPPSPTVTLDVHVVAARTDRPILHRFHEGGAIRKRSILFVSEGFTQEEAARFERLVSELGRRMLQVINPYNLLRESFDLYRAFVPSQESGVTFAPPVVPLWGHPQIALATPPDQQLSNGDFLVEDLIVTLGSSPSNPNLTFPQAAAIMAATPAGRNLRLKQITFDVWRSLQHLPAQPRTRETAFGLMLGERRYGSVTEFRTLPTPPPPPARPGTLGIPDVLGDLLQPRFSSRVPTFDERRLPDLTTPGANPETAHIAAQDRFVRSLRTPNGPAGFGSIWATGGDCFGLVVYLLNSDHYGGVRGHGYVAMSIGSGFLLATAPSTLVPGLIDVSPVPRPMPQLFRGLGFRDAPLDMLIDVIAHELAHTEALGSLGDEYGSDSNVPTPPDSPEAIAFVEDSPNTQTLTNARGGPGPAIQPLLLKWNWERIEAAADVADRFASGGFLHVGLAGEDMSRWPSDTIGRTVSLRTKHLRFTGGPQVELIVRAVDPGNLTLRLELLPSSSMEATLILFPPGSTLVLPRVVAGAVTRLVHPAVIAVLAGGPFASSLANCGLNPVQHPPAAIAGFRFPPNRNQTLGAYESSANFNCGAIRPAAECKMRTIAMQPNAVPVDFCFVCKYAMVDAVDCGAHGALDRLYPR
ncbi:MAG: hypothetical protein KIT31_03830 [Deltaproteobacteria bacterium]|nr:hypothetical protein [Deltaproteobacteria bacterium]